MNSEVPERSLPHRLRRLPELCVHYQTPIFFLTLCVHGRQCVLATHPIHGLFRSFCMTSPQLARVWVGRYVLMPDHIHIFIATENLRNLSRWVGSLKKYFAAHWRRAGSEGPFWQKGFFDHLLRSEESYQEKWEYVRRNPVRAGLVTHPDEWPFCGEIERLRW